MLSFINVGMFYGYCFIILYLIGLLKFFCVCEMKIILLVFCFDRVDVSNDSFWNFFEKFFVFFWILVLWMIIVDF